ncbi:MAG: siderophore-interacting protein [Leucobacter sp.]
MATKDSPSTKRPARPQIVLEVLERVQLSPHMVRIVAGGPGISSIEDTGFTDSYSKMLFPHPETDLTPPYDLDELRKTLAPELIPSTRTYTVRRFDLANGQIWIDFVTHGDEGVAGPWADRVRPGDSVVLRGIGGAYAPDASADWHLLAGDEAALPAIAAALEAMPSTAQGVALIEVGDEADRLELTAPEGMQITWLYRGGLAAGTSTVLIEAVRHVVWRDGRVQVFVHGERGAMKALRTYFTDERGLDRSQLSLSPYWAYGRREDAFQAEKREPIGKI